MLRILNSKLRRLYSRLRWPVHRRSKSKIIIKKFGKSNSKSHPQSKHEPITNGGSTVHPNGHSLDSKPQKKPIRIATFNAALFSMAPAVPKSTSLDDHNYHGNEDFTKIKVDLRTKSINDRPKSILKQSPLHPNLITNSENLTIQQKFVKSKLRVSINLPDNEISLLRNRQLSFVEREREEGSSSSSSSSRGKAPLKSNGVSFFASSSSAAKMAENDGSGSSRRTIVEVLRELDADILALQDVKAEEEKGMKPLSDLADALGMSYVFAESWAPEYGNAVLSKWPIKKSRVQKIFDDTDFRNILKATIDVPQTGEINFHCTHLDHLDENWRMKQIDAIIQSNTNNEPHILAGGLNSLDETDYSTQRWTDIVKYYEEIGKPTPKAEVMRFLKSKQYTDAKGFTGECEPVVMIAKGQSVQGTCKYGTRVDYILASPNSPYKFVPGSYSVFSSKGTSDHHIVKVDIVKVDNSSDGGGARGNKTRNNRRQPKQKVVKITNSPSSSSKGLWKTHT